MARPVSSTLTDSERRILEVLWKKKEASVREVADELSRSKPVAYTTVLTMFKVLDKKGLVHHRTEGRAFIYSAAISRGEARRQALENLLRSFFNDSPTVLAQHLIEEHDMDADELAALQKRVDDAPTARKAK
ncbi:putative transcriptional regulator [Stenotrophomonas maltophilia]|jgi:BlaI family transcriptional regulator, penicillinase repressor|uniref:BlaI/MecI/CopY family transcriptional regulator n=1 Tax=Stenotrophomonas chelatiphaga TaxID=517011 RepID=UPI000F4C46E0|nr:BlaI/MecI/CopY family transcriptional regulator [Stenotrophomonas chelatiphaga]MCS4229681.1 putative transcriptional regulator [Stenotrophomonas chelatiphaga]ROQ36923.1 putative transcriptional regulator [Stenotrophomonas maltophilia]